MTSFIDVRRLHKPLAAAGIVPEHCRLLEMAIGPTGAFILRYEVFVTAAQLSTIGAIFQSLGDEFPKDDQRAREATP